ncbi:ABC transporter ATP-binding protein [Pseudomonas putida]
MFSESAIKVEGLSKCFHIYDKPRDRLLQMLGRGRKQYFREFWALRDVSLDIKTGETVGIVGRNGSGKSTLLQIICGTLTPTDGHVQTTGRIAALLELGSGFNPEFTGRENVYMNAAVLGLSRAEIDARFADIESFAEIGDFIDQPVKSYSSGMMVRLAFSVAINADPQILIVDEALSVGDELFQRKCFARIEAIKASGATILFVSHSGSTIIELCDRAILLDGGEKLLEDTPKSVIGKYQRLLYAPADKIAAIRSGIRQTEHPVPPKADELQEAPSLKNEPAHYDEHAEDFFDPNLKSQSAIAYESHGATIKAPRILDLAGRQVNCLKRGNTYRYVYEAHFDTAATGVRFGMMIKTLSGVELGGSTSSTGPQDALAYVEANTMVETDFSFQCNLNTGTYFLNAGILGTARESETYLHRLLDACLFRVIPEVGQTATGVVDFKCVPDLSISSKKDD